MGENALVEDRKPALSQIRSIIPVLEEFNLLPNRGFYLKLSDASHAIYVTLPQDQNELILGNKLKLGQFIYAQKLEDAEPFPLLKDFTPLPGRRPCDGMETLKKLVSPVRSAEYDNSDDNSSSISRRRMVDSAKKIVKSTSTKSKNTVSKKINCEQAIHPIKGLLYDRQGAESGISWDSLPSSLVELDKEVVKKRDIALFAAAEALQEDCAAERLLNSLSKFSEFHLPEEYDPHPHIDTFLDLQDDMAQTRLIMKSLTNISPPTRREETGSTSTSSDNEASTITAQRKKNAATWIKSAEGIGSKEDSNLDESEIETCHRVRNKVCGILLKHVERTAMAFESSKMLRYIVDN
ncbi:hypothetical protein RND71_000365 [Anisodus tanguticus]|uniref:Uncharacterized protein n=1 Tax=Anisodus tanguticus TaxID=243964 RepID=A0AAE1VPY5_9SOLA|nr:hypothetical protein RND71_000365 [Anisodus tanguticus]